MGNESNSKLGSPQKNKPSSKIPQKYPDDAKKAQSRIPKKSDNVCVVEDLEGISIELTGSDDENNAIEIQNIQADIPDNFNLISQESQSLAISVKNKLIPHHMSVNSNETSKAVMDLMNLGAGGDFKKKDDKELIKELGNCAIIEKKACDQTVSVTDMLISNAQVTEGERTGKRSVVSCEKNQDVPVLVSEKLDTSQAWNVDLSEETPQTLRRKPGIDTCFNFLVLTILVILWLYMVSHFVLKTGFK